MKRRSGQQDKIAPLLWLRISYPLPKLPIYGILWREILAHLEDLEECGFIRKNDWRGNAFERVCIAHVPQIKKALGIAGVHADIYSWKVTGSSEIRGAQVDLLIDRRDGIVNLCEMKYSGDEFAIDKTEDANLANRVSAFRKMVGAKKTIHVTIVTANGLKHNTYRNNVHSEIGLDDLFAN